MKSTTSKFTSHLFKGEVAGETINYRILKMESSLFIYIGKKSEETLDGLALAITLPHIDEKPVATSITESPESQDLAQKLSTRLGKPIFVSYNANVDRMMFPLVEKLLIQEIKEKPDYF